MRAGLPRGRQPPCLYPACSRGWATVCPALAHQLTCCLFSRHNSPSLSVGGWGSRGGRRGAAGLPTAPSPPWEQRCSLPPSKCPDGLDSVQRHLYKVCGQGDLSHGAHGWRPLGTSPGCCPRVEPPPLKAKQNIARWCLNSSTMGCLHLRDYLHQHFIGFIKLFKPQKDKTHRN